MEVAMLLTVLTKKAATPSLQIGAIPTQPPTALSAEPAMRMGVACAS